MLEAEDNKNSGAAHPNTNKITYDMPIILTDVNT
jgi:hypothetical protein